MRRMRNILVALMILVLTTGCYSLECTLNHAVNTTYTICDADGQEQALTDTLWVVASRPEAGVDSVLVNRLVAKSSFTLPCSFQQDEDVMFMVFHAPDDDELIVDTVCVRKTNLPQFESMECQPTFFHELQEVTTTHNRIDSIVIKDATVNYDTTKKNLYIYLRSFD